MNSKPLLCLGLLFVTIGLASCANDPEFKNANPFFDEVEC